MRGIRNNYNIFISPLVHLINRRKWGKSSGYCGEIGTDTKPKWEEENMMHDGWWWWTMMGVNETKRRGEEGQERVWRPVGSSPKWSSQPGSLGHLNTSVLKWDWRVEEESIQRRPDLPLLQLPSPLYRKPSFLVIPARPPLSPADSPHQH